MELDEKIKNHRVLFNNDRIPGLSLDNGKKRYVFSRRVKGRNLRLRFPFSRIQTIRDYANMIEECRRENENYETEKTQIEIERKENLKKKSKKHTWHLNVSEKFRRSTEKFKKWEMKKQKKNETRRKITQRRKRIKFINSIPKATKMKLIDDIKSSEMEGKEIEEIRKMNVDYEKMTPEIYQNMLGNAMANNVRVENQTELGTKSLTRYKSKKGKY